MCSLVLKDVREESRAKKNVRDAEMRALGEESANADEDNSSVIPALPGMAAELTDLPHQLMGEDNNPMTMENLHEIEDNAMTMKELEQLDDNVDDDGP